MIKAVIFDCFGVLAQEGFFPYLKDHFANNPDAKQTAIDTMSRMSKGLISHDACIQELADLAGISFDDMEHALTDNPSDEQLFMYIEKKLKPRVKVAMLSNAGADRINELFGNSRSTLFDVTVLSYQVGIAKPDPEIYKMTADKLGVNPNECVFVDDVERYCTAAKEVGMETIWHKDASQTIASLDRLVNA